MVRDGQVVILDSGTTTTAIAGAPCAGIGVNIDKDKMLSPRRIPRDLYDIGFDNGAESRAIP